MSHHSLGRSHSPAAGNVGKLDTPSLEQAASPEFIPLHGAGRLAAGSGMASQGLGTIAAISARIFGNVIGNGMRSGTSAACESPRSFIRLRVRLFGALPRPLG